MRYAVDGILFRGDKVVLIKRKGRTFHDYWAIPGGIVEEGETVEKALIREMLEELNVKVKPKTILGVSSNSR